VLPSAVFLFLTVVPPAFCSYLSESPSKESYGGSKCFDAGLLTMLTNNFLAMLTLVFFSNGFATLPLSKTPWIIESSLKI